MKKILWHSVESAYPTGYGQQTNIWTKHLVSKGHTVVISSVSGRNMTYTDTNGILTLSQGVRGSLGNDFIRTHVSRVKPDILISMSDTFTYELDKWREVERMVDWWAWQVIDSEPMSKEIYKRAEISSRLLAMSRFGEHMINNAGYMQKCSYVPLAYDPNDYYMEDKDTAREWILDKWHVDWRGKFVIVMNCANMSQPSRKNFACAFMAFRELLRSCPNAILYVHTEITGLPCNGENLVDMALACGLSEEVVNFPPQYEYNTGLLNTEFLRKIYNAGDVMLYTSRGEGFGIPIIEAQACGMPVIVPNFSAMPELVHYGHVLPESAHVKWMYYPYNIQVIVDHNQVKAALQDFYQNPRPKRDIPEIRQYEIANVYDKWMKPLLDGHTVKDDKIAKLKEVKL